MYISELVYDVAYLSKRMRLPESTVEHGMRTGGIPGAFDYFGHWVVCKCIFEWWAKSDPKPVTWS